VRAAWQHWDRSADHQASEETMINRSAAVSLLLACALATPAARAQGLTYQFSVFNPTPPPGALGSFPWQINANGAIAASDLAGVGVIYEKNKATVVSFPDGSVVIPYGINSQRTITGTAYPPDFSSGRGFVRDYQGNVTWLSIPGATYVNPYGINEVGTVVGDASDADGNPLGGFIAASDGTVSMYSVPGADYTQLSGVNTSGTIVGRALTGLTSQALALIDGNLSFLNIPGATSSQAFDISNPGQIAGLYTDAQGATHGMIYDLSQGTLTTLDIPFDTPPTITIDFGPPLGEVTFVRTSLPTISVMLSINEHGDVTAQAANEYDAQDVPGFRMFLAARFTGQRAASGPGGATGGSRITGASARVQSLTDMVLKHGPLRGQKVKAGVLDNGAAVLVKP
jgi:hypothetical protein